MPRETDEPMDEPPRHDDRDPRLGDAVERAYGERVDLDTAARHLWVLYRSAGELGVPAEGEDRQEPAGVPSPGRGATRGLARMRHAALSVLTGVVVLATSGAAVAASGSALPGDALYPVKRGTEQLRLVIATSSGSEGRMRVALARERWIEAKRAVADRPDAVPALVRDAVESLEAAEREREAADEASSLRRQLVDETPTVAADLNDEGRQELQASLDRLSGSAGTEVAGVDDAQGKDTQGDVTVTDVDRGIDRDGAVTSSEPGDGSTAEDGEGSVPDGQDAEQDPSGRGEGDEDGNPSAGESEADDDGAVEAGPSADGDAPAEDEDQAGEDGDAPAEDRDGEAAGEDGAAAGGTGPVETGEVPVAEQDVDPDGGGVTAGGGGVTAGGEEVAELPEEARSDESGEQGTASGGAGPESDRGAGVSEQAGQGGGAPASSPTLSPDPTQRRVSGR